MKNRVELHCHTKMSQMEGLADVRELIRKAKKMGMPAIAITDRDSVQAFPEAYEAFIRLTAEMESSENYTAKVLYGLEAYAIYEELKQKNPNRLGHRQQSLLNEIPVVLEMYARGVSV